jgi:hypothetical protein
MPHLLLTIWRSSASDADKRDRLSVRTDKGVHELSSSVFLGTAFVECSGQS